eukprot:UN21325
MNVISTNDCIFLFHFFTFLKEIAEVLVCSIFFPFSSDLMISFFRIT